jgi:N-acetylmuramoyl-L-alanine amidase
VLRARAVEADFFISIHADSHDSPSISGATVYSIEMDRAEREAAKLLADRERAGRLVGGEHLGEVDETVARMLLDLSREASINKSRIAGEAIIHNLSRVTKMLRPSVQRESFAVLTSPDIPSLLVETAFVTNPTEAARLRDASFQQSLAQAMMSGIVDFFRDYAPSESYLAHNPPPVARPPIRHVIARGETLSEIAERYRISLLELRRTNSINGDVIRIGQVLTIPTSS